MTPGLVAGAGGSSLPTDERLARSLLSMLSVKDIGSGSWFKDGIAYAAKCCRSSNLFAGARMQPVPPVEPPASFPLLGGSEERIGPRGIDPPDHEGCLRVCRRIEQALKVAAVREHEGRALAHDLSRLVNALPWRDVVGDASDDVAVGLHFAHVDGLLVQRKPVGIDERIGEVEIEIVAMQTRREAGRVGVPIEDVESRRLISKQIVVDPVIPDQ